MEDLIKPVTNTEVPIAMTKILLEKAGFFRHLVYPCRIIAKSTSRYSLPAKRMTNHTLTYRPPFITRTFFTLPHEVTFTIRNT